ncbi:hypothetical protein A3K63_05090 [Candidatus Micrarchaeota archaeon RBG_16_49_10]|nr:MAG: hypothetical protein A3K63_05090 [Candidatus Micrarchaeota archaeon RBG_16_49_10]
MKKLALKKDVNLFTLVMYGIGVIVGAGIYVIIGKAAAMTGNSLWMAFMVSFFVGGFTAMSYAELSSMFSKDASIYHYTQNAFRKEWVSVTMTLGEIAGNIIGAAAVSLGFAAYFSAVFGTPYIWNALGLVILMSLVNLKGIKESTILTIFMTSAEVLGLILIIVFGIPHWGSVNYMEMPSGAFGVFSAAALIFFAFLGFEDIVNMSEETRNAKKVVPKALLISLAISSILYILVSISVVSIVDWRTLGQSEAPLKLVAGQILGSLSPIMSFIILFSTGGTVLILLLSGSRMLYGLSEAGKLPKAFSQINGKTRTPHFSVLLTMVLVFAFVMMESVEFVAKITDFMAFAIFALVNLSNIVLRYRRPDIKREFKSPLSIGKLPVLSLMGFLSCLAMIFFLELDVILVGALVLVDAAGLLVLWKRMKR